MKRIVIFGFGVQGNAQAKNLFDGGFEVSVFLRPSSPRLNEVKKAKIKLITDLVSAAQAAEIASILIPDGEQPKFWKELESYLPKGSAVIFAHGFNIHYKKIIPRDDLDIILVSPHAQGDALRKNYLALKGTPCQIAIAQDAGGYAKKTALEYAEGIAGRGPFIESTFKEETETDLFAEQAVICGGLFDLIKAGFTTLVEMGYNPEIAYFCCLKEISAIADLIHEHGIKGARERISLTALFGSLTRGERIISEDVKNQMRKILTEIKSGQFASELSTDQENQNVLLRKLFEQDKEHLIEKIHKKYSKKN